MEGSPRTFLWGIAVIGLLVAAWAAWIVIFGSDEPEPESSVDPNATVTVSLEAERQPHPSWQLSINSL